jgi:DNA polymerase-1
MKKKYMELFSQLKENLNEVPSKDSINSRVLIVDGLNRFISCFIVIPVVNEDGFHVGGLGGFLKSLGYAIEVMKPTRVIVVFDGKGGSLRRKKLYPEYKERRSPSLKFSRLDIFQNLEHEKESMHKQMLRLVQYLSCLPVTMFAVDNVEADDVIAYITGMLDGTNKTFIMSTDKDFLQLVSDNVEVWNPMKKKIYTKEAVKEDYGVPAENMCLYRAINSKGDKSDNIKGVRGVGEKTLLKKFPLLFENVSVTIDDVLNYAKDHLDENDVVYKRVYESGDIIKRNHALMQLSDSDISATTKTKIFEKLRQPINTLKKMDILRLFNEDKLWSSIPNFDFWLRSKFLVLDRFAALSHKEM